MSMMIDVLSMSWDGVQLVWHGVYTLDLNQNSVGRCGDLFRGEYHVALRDGAAIGRANLATLQESVKCKNPVG